MKKLVVAAAAVLFVAAMATVALSDTGGRGHGKGPCRGEGSMAAMSKLDLTADQTAKMKALQEAHLKEVKPLEEKLFAKRGDMRLLWIQETPDQQKIKTALKEMRELRDQIQDKKFALHQEMLKVLTPEQQSKLKSRFAGFGFCHDWDDCGGGGGGLFGDRGRHMGKGMHGDRW